MGLLIEVEVVGLLLESIKERFILDIHIWRKDLRKQWHFGRALRSKRTILTQLRDHGDHGGVWLSDKNENARKADI